MQDGLGNIDKDSNISLGEKKLRGMSRSSNATRESLKDAANLAQELRNLISEVRKFRHLAYINGDGHKVTIFYSNNGVSEGIDVDISDDNDKSITLKLSDNGDSFELVRDGKSYKINPDINGDDDNLVSSALIEIKKYINECRSYRNKKEEEDQKSPLIVEFNKLFDKTLKGSNEYIRLKNDSGEVISITSSEPNNMAYVAKHYIDLSIGDNHISFERNYLTGKFGLGLKGGIYTYELDEEETRKVLQIIEKFVNGDGNIKFEDLPPRYLECQKKAEDVMKLLDKYIPYSHILQDKENQHKGMCFYGGFKDSQECIFFQFGDVDARFYYDFIEGKFFLNSYELDKKEVSEVLDIVEKFVMGQYDDISYEELNKLRERSKQQNS